ncbi:unnamed protein product (macronuclear) [Paramecium tetraurelia]|uniref:Myb-like domain-containing protein n=1 Tax=Paramecium tetraurelia TaxID=5888 RepID=A0CGW4_PARTE|nr:uncharacterized protein GSPATT00007471001 [Paramecium tetraurelia]CAK70031.1 unnamed protein product [Paramecium tetraurelia]|eukprot:XP_001437428.1 hypothetical protein (macronuclear) [Paramecium tetraurelia strain d4-2]
MKSLKWTEFLQEIGDSKDVDLNEEQLKQIVKFPNQKMTYQQLEHYLSNEFKVHFNQQSNRSKWHQKDKYLFIWCVAKLAEKRNLKFYELHHKGVFEYLAKVLDVPEQFLLVKWMSLLKQSLKQLPWTPEEDKILIQLRQKYPSNNWTVIAEEFIYLTKNLRYQKQIRERYNNVINSKINKKPFTYQEKYALMLHANELNKNWSGIAKKMQGRTDNKIKNCYNSIMKKIAKKMHLNKLNSQTEKKILKLIKKYNTCDPDELASQIEKVQTNLSPLNESLNTFNEQHLISPILPSVQPIQLFYPFYMFQPNIGFPLQYFQ